jgi:hypothetical protein
MGRLFLFRNFQPFVNLFLSPVHYAGVVHYMRTKCHQMSRLALKCLIADTIVIYCSLNIWWHFLWIYGSNNSRARRDISRHFLRIICTTPSWERGLFLFQNFQPFVNFLLSPIHYGGLVRYIRIKCHQMSWLAQVPDRRFNCNLLLYSLDIW